MDEEIIAMWAEFCAKSAVKTSSVDVLWPPEGYLELRIQRILDERDYKIKCLQDRIKNAESET